MSMVYHPQTNDQTKPSNRIVEYMLSIIPLDEQQEGIILLTLVQFAYNNSVTAS